MFQHKCLNCGKEFENERSTSKFCSHACSVETNRKKLEKWKTVNCSICGKSFQVKPHSQKKTCSEQCKRKLISLSERNTMLSDSYTDRLKQYSQRMQTENPMQEPGTIQKMLSTKEKNGTLRQWTGTRGGNGKYTVPQILLWRELGVGWELEYPIPTHQKKNYPTCYRVDLAFPLMMLAVEVDGNGHRWKKQLSEDWKKTELLESLGWTVLRFTNEEITTNCSEVAFQIKSFLANM